MHLACHLPDGTRHVPLELHTLHALPRLDGDDRALIRRDRSWILLRSYP
jgi:hypothetical protein